MNKTRLQLPHISVTAIIEQDQTFLMVEEAADGRECVINQPSGHVEHREFPIAATIRETLEETGYRYQPSAIVGIYYYYSPSADITFQRICFTGDIVDHDPQQPLDDGIIRAAWYTRDALVAKKTLLRSEMVLRCIDDYLKGQRYPLELLNNLL